ncbi:efflux RND transporter periplasmic adaptor subunit [bacterium]|nr:efflux RND transporter periplasmic adaptor subunit [bacterium]MBU1024785.1 efflux RND transporter periplasmic adaptor subunit [bacterium]
MIRFSYVCFFIILIAISSFSCKGNSDNSKPGVAPPATEVKVERGPISLSVSSSGRIVSNLDVEIKCKASGEVIALPFDVSDKVSKGDLVVELDPVDENRNVKKSQVAVSSSDARLNKAEQSLKIGKIDLENAKRKAKVALDVAQSRAEDARSKTDRIRQLFEKQLAGREELETAETNAIKADADLETALIQIEELKTEETALELKREDVSLAKADLESAKINLSIAQQRLDDTKVYSPIDGIVTERQVQTGQIISSGISNVGGGSSILTLSDLSKLFVLGHVDESDIGNIKLDLDVNITVDAYPGKTFKGKINRIAQKGVNMSNVVTFEVRIEVLSENKSLLKPEMTTDVEIFIADKDDALLVPVGAIKTTHGKSSVTVKNPEGQPEPREIEIGINNGEMVEIVSGLEEGEILLITAGEYDSEWRKRMESMRKNGSPMRGPGGR